jgi:hypothetical protein
MDSPYAQTAHNETVSGNRPFTKVSKYVTHLERGPSCWPPEFAPFSFSERNVDTRSWAKNIECCDSAPGYPASGAPIANGMKLC